MEVQTLCVLPLLAQLIGLMLQMQVQALYLLVTPGQLIRLHIASGGPSPVLGIPSGSIDWITCCRWWSKPCICYLISLN